MGLWITRQSHHQTAFLLRFSHWIIWMFKCSLNSLCSHYLQLEDYSLDNTVFTSLGLPGHFFLNSPSVGLVLFLYNRLFLPAASWVCMRPISCWFCGDSSYFHFGSWLGLLVYSVMPSFFLTPPKRDLSEMKVGTIFQVRVQWVWGGGGGDDPHMMLFLIRNVMTKENFWTEQNSDTKNTWNGSRGISGTFPLVSFHIGQSTFLL